MKCTCCGKEKVGVLQPTPSPSLLRKRVFGSDDPIVTTLVCISCDRMNLWPKLKGKVRF